MSLVDFVKLPQVRAVHDRHATLKSVRLPPHVTLVACPETRLGGAIGTAFDYMTRFRLAAAARRTGVAYVEGPWIADLAVAKMFEVPYLRESAPRWGRMMVAARELVDDLANGTDVPVERLARCAQYLGAADLLWRIGDMRSNFTASDAVTAQLIAIDAAFDHTALLPEDGTLFLNPILAAGDTVGGADPDLVSGSCMLDVKTTIRPSADAARLRQVCAYAALCDWKGVTGQVAAPPMTHVGFAFPRQGLQVRYALEDIFGGRYADYRDEFIETAVTASVNISAPRR